MTGGLISHFGDQRAIQADESNRGLEEPCIPDVDIRKASQTADERAVYLVRLVHIRSKQRPIVATPKPHDFD